MGPLPVASQRARRAGAADEQRGLELRFAQWAGALHPSANYASPQAPSWWPPLSPCAGACACAVCVIAEQAAGVFDLGFSIDSVTQSRCLECSIHWSKAGGQSNVAVAGAGGARGSASVPGMGPSRLLRYLNGRTGTGAWWGGSRQRQHYLGRVCASGATSSAGAPSRARRAGEGAPPAAAPTDCARAQAQAKVPVRQAARGVVSRATRAMPLTRAWPGV